MKRRRTATCGPGTANRRSKMSMRTKILRAALVAAALLLAACGGGGGGGSDQPAPVAEDPVMTVGAISGFGSVHVNGVRFETSGAQITLNE